MYRICLDIGGTKTVIGLVDERGELHQQVKLPSAVALHCREDVVASLAGTIRDFCRDHGVSSAGVQGVAIGVPGIIDPQTRVIDSCPNLPELDQMPLAPLLSEALGIKAWVVNDVNLIALGEHEYGRGRGVDDLACIFVGTGIGCGLIANGQLYPGADNAAGEFGHISIEPEGRLCSCGNRGCLEMYCSGKAFAIAAGEILGTESASGQIRYTDAVLLNEAARSGNLAAKAAIERAFWYLGIGLTNLANIMNPRLIILGGGIVTGWPEGLEIARAELMSRPRVPNRQRLELDYPVLGERAGLLGAAVYIERALRSNNC